MKNILRLVTLSLALFGFVSVNNATACEYCHQKNSFGSNARNLDYKIPYFAAYPPVYYSRPIPRTYGYSPFAYGRNVRTPDLSPAIQPQILENKFVPAKAQSVLSQPKNVKPQDKTTALSKPGPLMVMNPFVVNKNMVAAFSVTTSAK